MGKDWKEVVSKKMVRKLLKEDFQKAVKILKWLNSLKEPVFFIFGNNNQYTSSRPTKKMMHGDLMKFVRRLNNIKYNHGKVLKFEGINIYGMVDL